MSYWFTRSKRDLAKGDLDLDTAVIKAVICMTNSTITTSGQEDAATVSALTLDEMTGTNYVRKTVASQAVVEDTSNNRAEFSFDPIVWTALGNGPRQMKGILLIRFITNDSDSVPIAFIDSGGFPLNPAGTNFTFTPNTEGALQVA